MLIFFYRPIYHMDTLSLKEKKEDLFAYRCMMFRLILYQQSGGSGFFAVNVIDCQQLLKLVNLVNQVNK